MVYGKLTFLDRVVDQPEGIVLLRGQSTVRRLEDVAEYGQDVFGQAIGCIQIPHEIFRDNIFVLRGMLEIESVGLVASDVNNDVIMLASRIVWAVIRG